MGHDEIVPGFNTFTIYQRFRALSYKLTGPLKEKRVTPSIISRLAKIKPNYISCKLLRREIRKKTTKIWTYDQTVGRKGIF